MKLPFTQETAERYKKLSIDQRCIVGTLYAACMAFVEYGEEITNPEFSDGTLYHIYEYPVYDIRIDFKVYDKDCRIIKKFIRITKFDNPEKIREIIINELKESKNNKERYLKSEKYLDLETLYVYDDCMNIIRDKKGRIITFHG